MKTYTTEEARAKLGVIITDALLGKPSIITYHRCFAVKVTRISLDTPVADDDSATTTETHQR